MGSLTGRGSRRDRAASGPARRACRTRRCGPGCRRGRVERAAGARDRGACLHEVRDVVERIVQPEDVDPVLRGARDEATDDVAADRTRADEEPSAERDPERRRHPCLDRTDPLPGALDAPADGGVEHAASRDLDTRTPHRRGHASPARRGSARDLGGRQLPSEWLLREQADRRVDQLRPSRPRTGPRPAVIEPSRALEGVVHFGPLRPGRVHRDRGIRSVLDRQEELPEVEAALGDPRVRGRAGGDALRRDGRRE